MRIGSKPCGTLFPKIEKKYNQLEIFAIDTVLLIFITSLALLVLGHAETFNK